MKPKTLRAALNQIQDMLDGQEYSAALVGMFLGESSRRIVNIVGGRRMATPKTLRGALRQIQAMLTKQKYSADLFDILSAIRGPDKRNPRLKMATTCLIRTAAFPNKPCQYRSFYLTGDNEKLARLRRRMMRDKKNHPHFREHVRDAFGALGLQLGGVNGVQGNSHRDYSTTLGRG
jgi:hypothetical protein